MLVSGVYFLRVPLQQLKQSGSLRSEPPLCLRVNVCAARKDSQKAFKSLGSAFLGLLKSVCVNATCRCRQTPKMSVSLCGSLQVFLRWSVLTVKQVGLAHPGVRRVCRCVCVRSAPLLFDPGPDSQPPGTIRHMLHGSGAQTAPQESQLRASTAKIPPPACYMPSESLMLTPKASPHMSRSAGNASGIVMRGAQLAANLAPFY